ncbi:unnamed protein product, partial [Leptidea sinapis]
MVCDFIVLAIMDKSKRERSANFSIEERDLLLSLLRPYQSILESKESSAAMWRKKKAAWINIQNAFNARSREMFRSIKTLRLKYEGLKRMVRIKSSMRSRPRTEDDKNTVTLDNVKEELKDTIHSSIELPSSNEGFESTTYSDDSDALPQCQQLPVDLQKKTKLDELTQARLELIQLKRKILEAEFNEKKRVWQFEHNERLKEAEFREKERKWKEEEYTSKIKLDKLRRELS